MKKIPLILLILNLIFVVVAAQTNSISKVRKNSIEPVKTVTPTKTTVIQKIPPPPPSFSTPISPLAQTITLPKFEDEIFAELNLLRRNPQEYAKYVEDYLKTYDGKYFRNGEGIMLASFEGKTPVEEAIATLKQTQPLPEFKLADGLIKAASDHSQDLVKNNKTGHRGTDASLPDERVGKYGTISSGVNENISYGAKNARDVILTMLIDDGSSNRSHRKNLLNPQLKLIGLATGENKAAGIHCILVLTDSFQDNK